MFIGVVVDDEDVIEIVSSELVHTEQFGGWSIVIVDVVDDHSFRNMVERGGGIEPFVRVGDIDHNIFGRYGLFRHTFGDLVYIVSSAGDHGQRNNIGTWLF